MLKAMVTDYEYESVELEEKMLAEAGIELTAGHWRTPEELIPRVADMDALIVQYAEISRDVIQAMKHCKMIVRYGIGIDSVDVEAATEKGIYVCNIPDYGLDDVSNHAIAFMFALMKKFYITDPDLRAGNWDYEKLVPITRFSESTVGIAGFGRLGQMVARKLKGFGVRLIAYDPYFNEKAGKELGVESVDFDTLVAESDYITIHCPALPENDGMFNDQVFDRMKKTAYVINTARGTIINEAALVRALKEGKIAGAGIDVFEKEPVTKDNPLLALPNVILSGHTAWYSETAIYNLHREAAEEVINVLQGNKPFHPCNRLPENL